MFLIKEKTGNCDYENYLKDYFVLSIYFPFFNLFYFNVLSMNSLTSYVDTNTENRFLQDFIERLYQKMHIHATSLFTRK